MARLEFTSIGLTTDELIIAAFKHILIAYAEAEAICFMTKLYKLLVDSSTIAEKDKRAIITEEIRRYFDVIT